MNLPKAIPPNDHVIPVPHSQSRICNNNKSTQRRLKILNTKGTVVMSMTVGG